MTPGGAERARLQAAWVKAQLDDAVDWNGDHKPRLYLAREFDLLRDDLPGMYLPRLVDEVDHVINLGRVSTHIMSHFSTSLKNWVGIMRPDDRLWMHQLTYLLNDRSSGTDPARSEAPYHEILAELHLATWERERLVFADASEVIVDGGPDETPSAFYPARLMLAASDLVSADIVNLAVLRMGALAAEIEGGLGGRCQPQPQTLVEVTYEYVKHKLELRDNGLMRGTDAKLCDPTFSNWDWLLLRRARELGLGPTTPDQVGIAFADDGDLAVPAAQRAWLDLDCHRPPSLPLQP